MSTDGTWEVSITTPMGEQKANVTVNTEGGKLSGKMEGAMVSKEFEGTVDGNNLAWEIDITNPMPITLKIAVTVDGDSMTGTVGLGMFGTAPLTGHRV